MTTDIDTPERPGFFGRLRSRQAGLPTGVLGRLIGRAMVKDTAAANDRALELLELVKPSTVLEIGFGQGRTVARVVEQGHRVIGVDASTTMVGQATARNRRASGDGRVELAHGDGQMLPFDDHVADAAFTVHTVYFMADPQVTFTEVARVLRPGGRFVVACKVGDDGMSPWMDPNVYRLPTIQALTDMLTTAGFEHITHHDDDNSAHSVHWFVAQLALVQE